MMVQEPLLKVTGLSKTYSLGRGDFKLALKEIGIELAEGRVLSILGPSGCGKSTLLKTIAGLEQAESGRIFLAGKEVTDWPAQKRPVHMIFQDQQLFPHMTVFDNVAFGLVIKRRPKSEVRQRVLEILEQVQIGDLGMRYPAQLSGGQKQRVALARSLVLKPKLLLMDEPFSALDPLLKWEVIESFKQIQVSQGLAFLMVTHDLNEANFLSDEIGVMEAGCLVELQPARELFRAPRHPLTQSLIRRFRSSMLTDTK
jgi:ABC-type Fe3+/spermidine/putrescine transport system ATPase subunit